MKMSPVALSVHMPHCMLLKAIVSQTDLKEMPRNQLMTDDNVANFASACMQVLALQLQVHLTAAQQTYAVMPLQSCIWVHGHSRMCKIGSMNSNPDTGCQFEG